MARRVAALVRIRMTNGGRGNDSKRDDAHQRTVTRGHLRDVADSTRSSVIGGAEEGAWVAAPGLAAVRREVAGVSRAVN